MIELTRPTSMRDTRTRDTRTTKRRFFVSKKRLFLFHLFLVLFMSEIIEDVECNGKLRGSSASSPEHHDEHPHDVEDVGVANLVAIAHDVSSTTKEEKKKILEHDGEDDHHPHDEMTDHNNAGANHHHNDNNNNNNKASYDSVMPKGEYWDETGPKDSSRPLLEFVMLVKNEAKSIVETINSVKDHVDRWTILDTGSTDGTQDLIREAFQGVGSKLLLSMTLTLKQQQQQQTKHRYPEIYTKESLWISRHLVIEPFNWQDSDVYLRSCFPVMRAYVMVLR